MKSQTPLSPSFLEGAVLALIAALAGTLAYSVIDLVLAGPVALRLVVAALGLGYLLYLLGRSRERIGRVTILALWLTVAGLLWVLSVPLSLYLLVHLAMAWLARSLYFHQGPLSALADLGITGLSLVAALGAYLHTGSLFLSLWCLFLVQALFVFIPSRAGATDRDTRDEAERFRRAHQAAEAAVQKLSSIP
jgi:hypothetical protein